MKLFSCAILLNCTDMTKAISLLTDAGIECQSQSFYSELFFQIEADCAADRHIDSLTEEERNIWLEKYEENIFELSEILQENYDALVDDEAMSEMASEFMQKKVKGELL